MLNQEICEICDFEEELKNLSIPNVDELIELMKKHDEESSRIQNMFETASVKNRICKHLLPCASNEKHHNPKFRYNESNTTGHVVQISKIPYIAVIDIDIKNKSCSVNDFIACFDDEENEVSPFITKTASGGLHIWCNVGDYASVIETNKFIKCIVTDDYDIDVFICVKPVKSFYGVMKWNSVAKNHFGEIGTYELVRGDEEEPLHYSLSECLEKIGEKERFDNFIKKMKDGKVVNELSKYEMELIEEKAREFVQEDLTDEIFDVIIKGFNKQYFKTEIHNYSAKNIEERISILNIITGLYACKEIVSDGLIENAKMFIQIYAPLTEKARNNFDTQWNSFDASKAEGYSWRILVLLLKYHATEYYESEVKPKVSLHISTDEFINSKYSLTEFKRECSYIKDRRDLINKLSQFIAISANNSFIIKAKESNEIVFKQMRLKELEEAVGVKYFEFRTTADEKQKMREQKKKVSDSVTIKLSKILTTASYYKYFNMYDNLALLSENKNDLQLYIPPAGNYNRQLIDSWLEFIRSRVVSVNSFNDLLDSHAYRFRHPDELIEKFFINYGKGNNGKSYLNACFAKVYGSLCNVGCSLAQITGDMFNSWMSRNLLIWMEEVEESVYKTKGLSNNVKLLTTKNGSIRGMYKETATSRNWAIVGMNTNQSDLYGLVRADPATISRLVIIEWKDSHDDKKVLNRKCHEFIDNKDFAYSLYYYLKYEHVINEDFTPCRYDGQEKYDFINKSKLSDKNSVELWLSEYIDNIFRSYKVKDVIYKFIEEKYANNSYRQFVKENSIQFPLKAIKDKMIEFGFEYKDTRISGEHIRLYRMTVDDFEKFKNKISDCEYDDEEGELVLDDE